MRLFSKLNRQISRILEGMVIRLPASPPYRLSLFLRMWEYGAWVRGHRQLPHFSRREQLYRYVKERSDFMPICYLEFGVASGDSLSLWAELNRHPESKFIGFDSFQGLPEPWHRLTFTYPAGSFGRAGKPPDVTDERITFIRGDFRDTLEGFLKEFVNHQPLVVHLDADLYSSTLFVLVKLDRIMVPGTILLLDDFGIAAHDFRAFQDYIASHLRKFEVLGFAGPAYRRVAVQLTS